MKTGSQNLRPDWRLLAIPLLLLATFLPIIRCRRQPQRTGPLRPRRGRQHELFRAGNFDYVIGVVNHEELLMNGKDGDTAITGDAGATSIRVSGVKRVLSESVRVAQAHLHKLQVRSGGLNTRALVETRQPACSLGREDIVDYPITQPVFLRLRTNNLDGVITVEAENNGITDNNLAGNVTLTDVAGSAAVNLLSGDNSARIPILPLSGGINLIVLNGNIYLVIPAATSAVFLAEVSSGKSIPRPWCC